MGVAAVATGQWGFVLAGLLAGLGHGYSFPVLMAQTVERTPSALRGSAVSLFTALWDLSKLFVVPAMGVLADAQGDAAMLGTCCAVGFLGLLGWARRQQ